MKSRFFLLRSEALSRMWCVVLCGKIWKKASRDRFSSNSTISFKGHIENFIILQNEP